MGDEQRKTLNISRFIVNDITNCCFRFLPKPYMEAFAEPKAQFLISFTIKIIFEKAGIETEAYEVQNFKKNLL